MFVTIVTDPSNEPEGAKLFGRSKVLPEATTVGDILWKDNNLMMNFRLRATPVMDCWTSDIMSV